MIQDYQELEVALDDRRPIDNHVDLTQLWQIAWRRRSLIALGIVAGIVLGSLYYAQATPVYRSQSQVLVVQKRPDVVTGDVTHMQPAEDYVNTHRLLLLSPLIVGRAIDQGKLRTMDTFAHEETDLTEAIIKKLAVKNVSKGVRSASNVLEISFDGIIASECGTVVNAILDSYTSVLDEAYRNTSDDTVRIITEGRKILQNDLATKEAAYRQFRETSPMIWKGNEEINPRQDRLTQIELQRSTLMLRRADFEGQLASIEDARAEGRSPEELMTLISDLAAKQNRDQVNSDSSITLKGQLLPLLQEEQILVQRYGPKHPQVLSVRQRIAATHEFFRFPSATFGKVSEQSGPEQKPNLKDGVEVYLQSLRQEIDRIKTSEDVLAKLFETEHQAARELNSYEVRDAEFRNDIARTQELYDGIVKRLHEASLVKDYGGFDARVISPAGIGKKVQPKGSLVFPASAFLGILGGIGLVYLAEIMDKSFRSPEEIRRRLGLPIVGQIPMLLPDAATRQKVAATGSFDPMLFTYHQPRSAGSEAYRAVRTALYFSSGGEGHKVIQITSANPSEGKSTLAANVAVSIAQSGKKTLLIDADLRKPRQHEIFAVSARIGLASVIGQDMEVADAVQPSKITNLSILPCGPLPPDPAELLTSPRLPELLEVLREQYDYVIIDSAPLLAVTDSCAVAPRVDGVLLTLRISKYGRSQAERAREILNSLGAKVLGVVVNGVDGSGAYGYGYGYGYGQGYGDSDAKGESNGNGAHKSRTTHHVNVN
jgi:succinoglycan biosynthesis transport protein ExoP